MLRITIAFIISILSCTICYAQDEVGSFEFEGDTRNYEVYLPQDYQPNMPVIIALHGWSETIKIFKEYTLFHELTNTSGFILVYPQGIKASTGITSWNSGWYHPIYIYPTSNDVGFISVLIDTMKTHYDIDLSRVYCCGFSAGGEMSFRLIGEIGYRFAAAASVGGSLFELAKTWEIIRPVPILQMNGDSDDLNPYSGDEYTWSITETLDYWLDKNHCSTVADTFYFPDIDPNDNCTIQKISYLDCSGDCKVVHYKGIGMGHSWPGSATSFETEGNKNRDISANVEILNFFNSFTNPLVNLAYGSKLKCNNKFYSISNSDEIDITAKIINPEDHQIEVYATIENDNSIIADSVELFDDGDHNDGNNSDNIFGSQLPTSELTEDFYKIKLHTTDLDESLTTVCPIEDYFTTAGPVVWKDYVNTPLNDSVYTMKVTLENLSSSYTVRDISARLSTIDSTEAEIFSSSSLQHFTDIEPGESVQNSGFINYRFSTKNNPANVRFMLKIYCNGIHYWTDSKLVVITDIEDKVSNIPNEFSLEQNYPNPFNPVTTIEYSIPGGVNSEKSNVKNVTLKIFDLLGREVSTLVNEKQKAGNYEVEFDGSKLTSGIYFYRLQAGEYVETKKMVLIK